MREKIACALMSVVMCFLCGCTKNDYVKPLYGLWQLESVGYVGVEAPADMPPCESLFWGFQSSVISMTYVERVDVSQTTYGNWDVKGEVLHLNFTADNRPILPMFGLPSECYLTIVGQIGERMKIEYRPTRDRRVTFVFHRY